MVKEGGGPVQRKGRIGRCCSHNDLLSCMGVYYTYVSFFFLFTFWGTLESNGFHCVEIVRQCRPLHFFKIPLNAGGMKRHI